MRLAPYKQVVLLLLGMAWVMLPGCRKAESEPASLWPADAQIKAYVSIEPQKYFVERIGGDSVAVKVLVAPGQEPHHYAASPQQMAALSQADLFFRIGVPFEKSLLANLAAQNPIEIIDTRTGITLRDMEAHGHEEDHEASDEHEHAHHHEHEHDQCCDHHDHDHGGKDPHIWLDPKLVKVQAGTIAAVLTQHAPQQEQTYQDNLQAFEAELDELDAQIRAMLTDLSSRRFMVFHPSFGYFADAYDLEQIAIEIEGKQPTARQLVALTEQAQRENIKAIFVSPQFDRDTARTVAESIGAELIVVDPLSSDYPAMMMNLAQQLQRAMP